jgi:hypothetical protein
MRFAIAISPARVSSWTHAEINDHLPDNFAQTAAIETIVSTFNDIRRASKGKAAAYGRAHFAHVHAHRVGRAAELGVDRRERDLRFLVGLVVRYGSRRGVVQKQRLRIGGLLVDRHARTQSWAARGPTRVREWG